MATCNLEGAVPSATESPFDILNEVGCVTEQIEAALRILSDDLHDEFERRQEREGYRQNLRLYKVWLLLELIRGSVTTNDRRFHEAESILYKAGVPRQFTNEGAVA